MPVLALGPWHLIALLGALQGVVLAGMLARQPTSRRAHRILALAVLAFSLHLASFVYYTTALVERYPQFFGLSHPLPFLFGPLLYLYARSASDRGRPLSARDLWHLAPFALAVLSTLPVLLADPATKLALFHEIAAGRAPWWVETADSLKLVSGIAYSLATLRLLGEHERVMADNYSALEPVNLAWLRRLTTWATAIWLLAIGLDLAGRAGIPTAGDQYISIAITLLIYGTGYLGLRQPEIFRFTTAEHPVAGTAAIPRPAAAAVASAEVQDDPPAARYERSGLTPREAEQLTGRLQALMDQARPWRNPDLTLADLATQLGTTPHKLSEVLNSQLALTFYDFVNGYRVREVQARLAGPGGESQKLLAIALDAGFASKSTFNAAFKKLTGRTPSEYRSAPRP